MTKEEMNGIIVENIRRLRKQKRLSQNNLATELQTMGIDITGGRISMIETNRRPASALLIAGLKQIFNCKYEEFYVGLEETLADLHGKHKK